MKLSNFQKIMNNSIRYQESLPVGHMQQEIKEHMEHTLRNQRMTNEINSTFDMKTKVFTHAGVRAKAMYQKTLEQENRKMEEFIKQNKNL